VGHRAHATTVRRSRGSKPHLVWSRDRSRASRSLRESRLPDRRPS
jgi:hypothetical protein